MTDTAKNVSRVLRKLGFVIQREGARHAIWVKGNVEVAVPRHKYDLTIGTFHNILKEAGLTPSDYIRLR